MMTPVQVSIWDVLPATGDLDWVIGYLSQDGVAVIYARSGEETSWQSRRCLADVLVLIRERLTGHDLVSCPNLRRVYRLTDSASVDVHVATHLGVKVIRPDEDVYTNAVAEHTLALILASSKMLYPKSLAEVCCNRLGFGTVETTAREYRYNWAGLGPVTLRGKALGLVGFGRIGRRVASLGNSLGMRVRYYCRKRLDQGEESEHGVEYLSLTDLCSTSDFLSLHVPYTLETHHLIDASRLNLMKPTAVVVNTSRGRVIDEDALVEVLQDGRLRGAALDVFAMEPISPDHPLLRLANVILTPHVAAGILEILPL
jgi:phosphoglycerate dehydrogenase-like enzyme